MFLPCGVFWKAVKIFSYGSCGVEYATRASLAAGSAWASDACTVELDEPGAPPHATARTRASAPTASPRTADMDGWVTSRGTGNSLPGLYPRGPRQGRGGRMGPEQVRIRCTGLRPDRSAGLEGSLATAGRAAAAEVDDSPASEHLAWPQTGPNLSHHGAARRVYGPEKAPARGSAVAASRRSCYRPLVHAVDRRVRRLRLPQSPVLGDQGGQLVVGVEPAGIGQDPDRRAADALRPGAGRCLRLVECGPVRAHAEHGQPFRSQALDH